MHCLLLPSEIADTATLLRISAAIANKSPRDIADELGEDVETVRRWFGGAEMPSGRQLIEIGYCLGLMDDPPQRALGRRLSEKIGRALDTLGETDLGIILKSVAILGADVAIRRLADAPSPAEPAPCPPFSPSLN